MSTQQFEVVVDNVAQAGSYATREEAEKAAAVQRSTSSAGRPVTVREKQANGGADGQKAPDAHKPEQANASTTHPSVETGRK